RPLRLFGNLFALAKFANLLLDGLRVHLMRKVRGEHERSLSCYLDRIGKVCFSAFNAYHQAACLNECPEIVTDRLSFRQVQQFAPRVDRRSGLIGSRKTLES